MEHQINFWVIQRKWDKKLLPMPPRRNGIISNFSRMSFEDKGPPRLFTSEISAQRALTAYCMGNWTRMGDSEAMPEPIKGTERIRSDYEITIAQLRY
jgi:hypothetical protein